MACLHCLLIFLISFIPHKHLDLVDSQDPKCAFCGSCFGLVEIMLLRYGLANSNQELELRRKVFC